MVTIQYKTRRYSLVLLKLQTMTEEFERNPGATWRSAICLWNFRGSRHLSHEYHCSLQSEQWLWQRRMKPLAIRVWVKYLLTVRKGERETPRKGEKEGRWCTPGIRTQEHRSCSWASFDMERLCKALYLSSFFSVSTEDGGGHCFREFALYTAEELTFKTPLLYPGEVSVLPSKRHCKV